MNKVKCPKRIGMECNDINEEKKKNRLSNELNECFNSKNDAHFSEIDEIARRWKILKMPKWLLIPYPNQRMESKSAAPKRSQIKSHKFFRRISLSFAEFECVHVQQ